MAVPQGKVPVLESARAGFAFARAHIAQLAVPALLAAVATAALQALAGPGTLSSLAAQIGGLLVLGVYFAFALRLALAMPGPMAGPAVGQDAARLLGAMSVIGFFLFIVFVVGIIPGFVVIGAMFAPYQSELEAAQTDPNAVMALAQRVAGENVPTLVLLGLVYAAAWLALTSRLYLAAPATVAEARVATFETWRWTAGNLLRITAARLILLVPIFIGVSLAQALAPALLGVSGGDATAMLALAATDPLRFGAIAFWSAFLSFLLYSACEAGLAAYLYKGLRPPD